MGHRTDGGTFTATTSTKSGENPVYNEDLHFGQGDWTGIELQAMDADSGWRGDDDIMTNKYRYNFDSKCDTVKRHMDYNDKYHAMCQGECLVPDQPGAAIEVRRKFLTDIYGIVYSITAFIINNS